MGEIISNWISTELIDSITHTVIQSIWQGAIIALITFALFRLKSDHNPIVKYRIALLGISSLFICSVITFISSYITGIAIDTSAMMTTVYEWTGSIVILDEDKVVLSNTWIGYLWILGVAIFSIKFLFDVGIIQYVRYTASESEQSKQYSLMLDSMQYSQNTSVIIKVSNIIQAPVTIGFFKPIILFPVGMLTQLTTPEVESILRHEMAHIIRKDYLMNIIQSLMEIVLFYHPLVWWLSKVAREEREYCCDDAALISSNTALDYAKTLVRIQELSLTQRQGLAMSFADQSLMNRIKRIMNLPKSNRNMREKLIAITAVLILIVFASKDMIANVTEKIWSAVEIENTEVPREAVSLDIDLMQIDTLPLKRKQSYSITKSDDNGSISIEKENGVITNLEIDGKEIPKGEYNQYKSEIESLESGKVGKIDTWIFSDDDVESGEEMQRKLEELGIDLDVMGKRFEGDMEDWAEGFGKSMESWGEQFGDSFEWHYDNKDSSKAFSFVMPEIDGDMMLELEDIIGDMNLDGISQDLSKIFEDLNMDDLNLRGRDSDRGFGGSSFGENKTVEDKIGYELRKDRLIATGEISEIELSGKHMKVNGDKQPKNIWNKYKEIFEEESGIELSKDSKLKFKVEGRQTMKKTSAF